MKRVMIDLDETTVSCLKPWIEAYNAEHGDNITVDQIKEWDFGGVTIKKGVDMFEYIRAPGFFRHLKPLDGAIKAIRELHELKDEHGKRALDIIVCTAVSHGNQADDKFGWFKDHLAFLGKRNLMIGTRKELIKVDVYIDDSPQNHPLIRKEFPDAHILTIAYPYNEVTAKYVDLRVGGHDRTAEAWDHFIRYIKHVVLAPPREVL